MRPESFLLFDYYFVIVVGRLTIGILPKYHPAHKGRGVWGMGLYASCGSIMVLTKAITGYRLKIYID